MSVEARMSLPIILRARLMCNMISPHYRSNPPELSVIRIYNESTKGKIQSFGPKAGLPSRE
jgi:hypothetical protein